jgi:high-affinity nickel permease
MEKIEMSKSKWSYTKAAAYSGTLGLIVGIVYTLINFIRFGAIEHLGGVIGGTIGQFFLIILGFVFVGVVLFAIYRFLKK